MRQLKNFLYTASFGTRILMLVFVFAVMFILTTTLILIITKSFPQLGERGILIAGLTVQSLFLFICTPIICARIFSNSAVDFLQAGKLPKIQQILWCTACMIVLTPALNLIITWNEGIQLPAALNGVETWMRNQENAAKVTTDMLLSTKSLWGVAGLILIVGVLTGIGEEFTFRGLIQQLVSEKSRNQHIAVWVTAFLFSAIHIQFFGFFPRLLLGAFFGYMIVWSHNIWLPVFAHFLNNSLATVSTFLIDNKYSGEEVETIGTIKSGTAWISVISIILFILCVRELYKSCKN
ncbi:MAG: CPBP family intramembrane glutamic endopeptidase [Bacteroidales bacterium]